MDNIIQCKLEKDILTNNTDYFFTILNNRFEKINEQLTGLLQKKYKKNFEPIYILSAEPGKFNKKKNYLIINKKLKDLRKKSDNKKIILLQDVEELNDEFSESKLVQQLIDDLAKKQERIFLISFSSFGLHLSNPKIINIGPSPQLVEKYDNKIEQIKLFKKLKLPTNKTKIFKNITSLAKAKLSYPSFVSPSFTSGGAENAIILSKNDLKIFFRKLREVNKNKEFFVAPYLENITSSPNSVGIVCGKNDARILCLTDQIIRGVKHTGNIYPSSASEKNKTKMIQVTKKIGNYLSSLGFRGMYGCDFIVDHQDKLYVIELNPRRQSTYLILQLMSSKINLLDMELKLALGEKLPVFTYQDIQYPHVWLHNKLKPHEGYQILKKEFRKGDEVTPLKKIGKKFITTYFPSKYILNDCNFVGYYIASGRNYNAVLKKSTDEINNILLKFLKNV